MRPWDNKILRYPIVKLFLISVYTYWLLYKSSWYVCCEIYRHGQYADYQTNSAHAAYSLNIFILGKLDRMLWVYWLSHETVQSIEFIEQALPYCALQVSVYSPRLPYNTDHNDMISITATLWHKYRYIEIYILKPKYLKRHIIGIPLVTNPNCCRIVPQFKDTQWLLADTCCMGISSDKQISTHEGLISRIPKGLIISADDTSNGWLN